MFMSREQIRGTWKYCVVCCFFIRRCLVKSSSSEVSWSLHQPPFALTVFYLSQQVEDKDYLEKVSGLHHQILVIQDECDVKKTFFKRSFLFLPQGSRAASALTAGTLTSLGGTSSRRGSGETAITVDAETSLREIKVTLKRCSFLWTERTFGLWFYHLDKIKVKTRIYTDNRSEDKNV